MTRRIAVWALAIIAALSVYAESWWKGGERE